MMKKWNLHIGLLVNSRQVKQICLILLLFVFAMPVVYSEANYLYHEASIFNPGCGFGSDNYRSVLIPNSAQSLKLAWKIEYQNYTNQTRVYYTIDGSDPLGSFGDGYGTTQVLIGSYTCTFNVGSLIVDVATATIPAQAAGKTVKYILSAWHSGGGDEIFANGPGFPCRDCGPITNSADKATVFSYLVANSNNVEVSASLGTEIGSYSTLKGAFDKINDGTHKGVVLISIYGNTTELPTAMLGPNISPANYTSIGIQPAGGSPRIITGDITGPLIELNGADNVTIDGREGGTGSTKALTITNTNTNTGALASTIRFTNDATNNTLKYCKVQGASTNDTGGVVFFSTAATGVGNDGNVITYNDISGNAAGRPVNAVYSEGTVGKENSGNTISNNNIFDFFNRSIASNAILLAENNTNWTISGNSFYETTMLAPTANVPYNVIKVANAGAGYLISGNYIGGNAATCGDTLKKLAPGNNTFYGIYLDVGSGTVKANTIKNINWANSGNADWTGIHVNEGVVTIGGANAIDGNIIGATVEASSIVVTAGAADAFVYGIKSDASHSVIMQYNVIGSIEAANSANSNTSFYGIYASYINGTESVTISNNLIGSASTPRSIYASSNVTGSTLSQVVIGILNEYGESDGESGGSVLIRDNTISNVENASEGDKSILNGINTSAGTNTIWGNIIHEMKNAGGTKINNLSSVVGINIPFASYNNHIAKNTIYNLECTSGSGSTNVIGIFYNSSSTGLIEKNFIHSLSTESPDAIIVGFSINTQHSDGINKFQNNLISLIAPASGAKIDGFYIGDSRKASLFFNTVSITGSNNVAIDACLEVGGEFKYGDKITNNIFTNTCGGSSSHYSINIPTNNGTVEYNDYIGICDPITLLAPGFHSRTRDPEFPNPAGTSVTDYIPGADTLMGDESLLTVITDDIDGTARCLPTMGALENTTPVASLVFALGSTSARCVGAGAVTYSATALHTRRIVYSLDTPSNTAGNTINPSTGEVTYTATWVGTTVITASAFGCGPLTATHTVTVSPKPATTPIYHN